MLVGDQRESRVASCRRFPFAQGSDLFYGNVSCSAAALYACGGLTGQGVCLLVEAFV